MFFLAFIMIQANGKVVFADAAGPLTSFNINYYSCPLWIQEYGDDSFAGKQYAPYVAAHTFKAICFGTGYPSNTLSDSITITVQN